MISILIPVKNGAKYLAPCIASILQQTEANWEAIFVDDHSTDTTLTILKMMAQKFPRISVLTSKGHGIIPALQTAFAQASGAYITRMDADDTMPIKKLELLKAKLLEVGLGHVVTGKVQYFSEGTLGQGYLNYQDWLNDLAENNTHYLDLYKECVVPSAGFLIHRQDLELIGGFDHQRYPEDYDLVFRFRKNKLKIVAILEVIHEWRDHPERTSRNEPVYAGFFFDLKVHYFLELDYQPSKQLVLIGAGKKGKAIAKELMKQDIPFSWLTNNPKKIGVNIYQKTLQSEEGFNLQNTNNQLIIAISSPNEMTQLQNQLHQANLQKGMDYFWFC